MTSWERFTAYPASRSKPKRSIQVFCWGRDFHVGWHFSVHHHANHKLIGGPGLDFCVMMIICGFGRLNALRHSSPKRISSTPPVPFLVAKTDRMSPPFPQLFQTPTCLVWLVHWQSGCSGQQVRRKAHPSEGDFPQQLVWPRLKNHLIQLHHLADLTCV